MKQSYPIDEMPRQGSVQSIKATYHDQNTNSDYTSPGTAAKHSKVLSIMGSEDKNQHARNSGLQQSLDTKKLMDRNGSKKHLRDNSSSGNLMQHGALKKPPMHKRPP